jgi:hypothetical protein
VSVYKPMVEKTGPREARPYLGTYEPLRGFNADFMAQRFGINPDIRYFGENERGHIVFKLHGPLGEARGYQVRLRRWGSPEVPGIPKSSTYLHDLATPEQAWYVGPGFKSTRPIVLVEDPLSAYKVMYSGLDSVALLGVHLDMRKVREIAAERRPIVFAYDKDATGQAFEHLKVWGPAFPKARLVMLEQDLKDLMTVEEIQELFAEWI